MSKYQEFLANDGQIKKVKEVYEYYVIASFPSGHREVMVFDTQEAANKQAQKYANRGAWHTHVEKEVEWLRL